MRGRQSRRNIGSLLALVVILTVLAACGAGAPVDAPADGMGQGGAEQPDGAAPGQPQVPPITGQQDQGEALPGRLLFVQQGTIWLWQGQQMRPLLGEGFAAQPEWSPDGTQIAFVEFGPSYSDILLANASGKVTRQLTNNSSSFPLESRERICDSIWAFYPTWSPETTPSTLVMASQWSTPICASSPAVEYNLALYQLPLSSGTRQELYSNDAIHVSQMTYAPDASAIVYSSSALQGNRQQQIQRLWIDDGEATPYPGAPARSYDPAFSPDGRWLAFAARADDRTDIWVLPGNASDGSSPAPQRLTNHGMARAPVFSPDGQQLAFLAIPAGGQQFELWVADLIVEGNTLQAINVRQLTTGMHIDANSGLSWAL